MAAIGIMIAGAVLNATAFVGGSYLAKSLSGHNSDEERVRHDKALEKYQSDYEKYNENHRKLLDWISKQHSDERIASQNLRNVDNALKLYNLTHKSDVRLSKPNWNNYYKKSSSQKTGELMYVGGGMLAAGYAISKFI